MARLLAGFEARPLWMQRVGLVILGVVAGLGQAPLDLWPATILALVVMILIHDRSVISARQAFRDSWFFGLGYFAFSLRWIVEPFLVDVPRHGWMAPFALVLMAGGMALFWGGAGYLARRFAPGKTLVFVVLLVGAEITRSFIFTGFPWALLGHIWVQTPFAQISAFTGPHGLSLLTLLVAWGGYAGFRGRLLLAGGGLAVLILLGLFLRVGPAPDPAPNAPLIRMVQPNALQHQKWDPAYRDLFIERLLALSSAGDVPELIVWPETALPTLLNYIEDDMSILDDAARGAPLVFGIQRQDLQWRYYNSLVVMEPGGVIADIYDKSHLVPFGEYIPGAGWISGLNLQGLVDSVPQGFTAGGGSRRIDIPGIGAVIPLICYEGIFAHELARGLPRPRVLMLITNDAWFGKSVGPYQHLAQAQLRAIEQGLPMIRVANTGVSAMIDAKGRILKSLPLDVHGTLDVNLPQAAPATPYSRWGAGPFMIFYLLFVTACFVGGPCVKH